MHSISSGGMQVGHHHVGGATVVALSDAVDLAAVPTLHQALVRAVDGAAGPVALDLDGVTVIDDAALGVIVGAAARARRRGTTFSIVCTDARIVERLAETRIDEIVPVTGRIADS